MLLSGPKRTPHAILSLALVALSALLLPAAGASQEERDFRDHFRVYTGDGSPATLEALVEAMGGVEAVLIGETHTDPVGHWLEAELLRRALERFGTGDAPRPMALSLEMFETDVQGIVDEYLLGLITEAQMKDDARAWTHYDTDYRPMVELAREAGVPVIAANAPRRYVNRVSRLGRDALGDLPAWSLRFLPPLPYPQPTEAYRTEWTTLMREMPMEDQCPAPEPEAPDSARAHGMMGAARDTVAAHGMPRDSAAGPPAGRMPTHMGNFMENGVQAQTLWDASMAHSMTTFLDQTPGALVLHMVGGFHVENFTGIPEKVQEYRPGTRSLVVSMEPTDDITSFDPEEHLGQGDFVILTDKALDLYVERNCTPRK